jgi:hypothetical protein
VDRNACSAKEDCKDAERLMASKQDRMKIQH